MLVKIILIVLGLRAEEVAQKLNLSSNHVSNLISGNRKCKSFEEFLMEQIFCPCEVELLAK